MSTQSIGKALLSAQNVVKSFGSQPILDGISLTIHDGDRIGLIGRNGCGKSTLMKILTGILQPDQGKVTRADGLRTALLSQMCDLPRELTVAQTLRRAVQHLDELRKEYEDALDALAGIPAGTPAHDAAEAHCTDLQHAVEAAHAWHVEEEIKRVSVALALPPEDQKLSSLSGGELRRVDLALSLLEHPTVLLLDEPTNHIDTRSVEWIEGFLERYEGSCVLVTHDRYFLDRVVNRIVELEGSTVYSFPGNYERFLEYKAAVEETQARAEGNRLRLIRRELAWFQRGAKARTTKQKARIDRLEEAQSLKGKVDSREFTFEIPEPERLGKTILEARKVSHQIGGKRLLDGFNCIMQPNMRVGILGPNGSGKTTLLRVLMGEVEPDKGKIIQGDTTQFLYVDQAHADINPDERVLDFVSNGAKHWEIAKRRIYVPAYLEKFLFDKSVVEAPMAKLSGGERNRLHLARQLLRGGNFLVLDEPTNDLDLYTLRVLEETIEAFEGCALVVSHDRYFLNRICTHMWIFEGDGEIAQITGNYDDYLLYRQRRKAEQQEVAREARKVAAEQAKPKAQTGARKLTWKEKKELDGMETAILEAEEAVEEAETRIQAPGFYEQGHDVVQGELAALQAAREKVESLYARWSALEALTSGG